MYKLCAVIPVYNHEHAIAAVVAALRAQDLDCILVDDGSQPSCAGVLASLAAGAPQHITLVRHTHNQGKGAAVLSGIARAQQDGYSHALQIDADGQHATADLPHFRALSERHPQAVIVGHPIYDDSVPKLRLYARYLTHVWVWINTLSLDIKDSMCGFRIYPVAAVMALVARQRVGSRMNFDTDILVRLHWQGVQMVNLGTRVSYPTDGVSHFRLWLDNVLITRMHVTLFFGMLLRLPMLLVRKFRKIK